MQVEARLWKDTRWDTEPHFKDAQLVLVFASPVLFDSGILFTEISRCYPHAIVCGCSTAGEIFGHTLFDNSASITAIGFAHSAVILKQTELDPSGNSHQAGLVLAESFPKDDLRHVLIFTEGIHINGSEFVKGVREGLPSGVSVTGGLAGDGTKFERTFVIANGDDHTKANQIVGIGFYGRHINIGFASIGGWDPFGPDRIITRSKGNILFELDNQPALALYKKYLGPHAENLPSSGLLFPLSLQIDAFSQRVVRTVLGVDEDEQSLVFAGDVPQGATANLMKANFDRLVDGAFSAATISSASMKRKSADLAILISCVGRRIVLQQHVEDELEAVREVLGENTIMTGFYSYGEICPLNDNFNCELHNQSMTITTLSEEIG